MPETVKKPVHEVLLDELDLQSTGGKFTALNVTLVLVSIMHRIIIPEKERENVLARLREIRIKASASGSICESYIAHLVQALES